jgi:hypothetical protein
VKCKGIEPTAVDEPNDAMKPSNGEYRLSLVLEHCMLHALSLHMWILIR